jgi:phospholipase A1
LPTTHALPIPTATATVIVSLLLVSTHALAQPASSALAECAAIAADSERLACFDRISGRAAKPAAPLAAATAATPAAASATSAAAAPPAVAADSASMFDKAWGFEPSSSRYDVSLYAPNYFLFGRYTTNLNTAPYEPLMNSGVLSPGTELDSTEAAFQLSFKFRMWTTEDRRWGVWAAYTQQSQWQLYNSSGNASRPFRETNYMPELILTYKPDLQWGDARWNLFSLAFNHQSNGRSDLLSRSWNRVIAGFGVEQGDFAVLGRLWWRIPESAQDDDNPTIGDYYGWGDLSAIYKWRSQSFSATIRGNPSTGKGAGQLAYTSSPLIGPLRGYVKVFSGYGETLIDYNWNQTTFGIGVTLNDWL